MATRILRSYRKAPRERLEAALDEILAEPIDPKHNLDAVESKLFGIGSESYVVGSHEFYLGYAIKNQKLYCLDAGHFHPTEALADKISSVLRWVPAVLLHVSRGVRWDSDHVVSLDDSTKAIMEELVRGDYLSRTSIGLDFFDASINRIAAWVIGTRNAVKALLIALLEPTSKLRELEAAGDYTQRLALLEEVKTLPFGAVWDETAAGKTFPSEPSGSTTSSPTKAPCFQSDGEEGRLADETQGLCDVRKCRDGEGIRKAPFAHLARVGVSTEGKRCTKLLDLSPPRNSRAFRLRGNRRRRTLVSDSGNGRLQEVVGVHERSHAEQSRQQPGLA